MNAQKRNFGLYSIRVQILAAVVMIVVLAVIITQGISIFTTQRELNREIEVNLQSLAETTAHDTQEGLIQQLSLLQVLAASETIEQAIVTQNLEYSGLDETQIAERLVERDEAWGNFDSTLISSTLQNSSSEAVTEFIEQFPNHTEIIITDRYGATVYTSANINEYVHNQDSWWQSAWRGGNGARYISPSVVSGEASGNFGLIMAIPIVSNGEVIGVMRTVYLTASIQSDVSSFAFGDTGHAVLLDANNQIIATENVQTIGTTLSEIPPTNALTSLPDEIGESAVGISAPVSDGEFNEITNLGWKMIIFQERSEAFAPINDALNATLLSTGIILVIIAGVSYFLAQRLTLPIEELTQTAQRLTAEGDYTIRVPHRDDRSEMGILGQAFNSMAEEVQTLVTGLESRVADRVKDLEATLEVGRLATSIQNAEQLLPRLADAIRESFDLYYTQIYLLDEARRYAILQAGTGQVGRRLIRQKHRIDLEETSIVSRTVQSQRSVLVTDTESSSIHLPNPLLPDTRSELAIPLSVGGNLLGVVDMQAIEPGTFNEENVRVFESMATQIAGALQSNNALGEAAQAIRRADELNRRLTRENWEGYLGRAASGERVGYQYDLESPTPINSKQDLETLMPEDTASRAKIPIRLGSQQVGNILVGDAEGKEWSPDELRLIEDVAARVAQSIEQLRAFDETESRARELAIVAEVSARATSTLDANDLLKSVADLTKKSFGLYHAHIYLMDAETDTLVLAAGSGPVGDQMVAVGHRIALNQEHSLVARSARTRAGTLSNNVMLEPDFLPNPLLPNTRSELAVPMIARNQLLGILDVQADRINRFTEEDLQVKSTLASQLAVSLSNARLFEQTQNALNQAGTLYSTSQTLASASNYQEILEIFSAFNADIGAYAASLSLAQRDASNNITSFKIVAEIASETIELPRPELQITSTDLNELEQDQLVSFITNVEQAPVADSIKEQLLNRNCHTIVNVPLITATRWLGMITIYWDTPYEFSENEQQYYQLLSAQVASLVDSLASLEESTERATEMQVVAEVSSLASSLMNDENVLNEFANLTKERFNRYHAQIYVLDETNQTLRLAAASGSTGEAMISVGHHIPLKREHSLVARAARSKRGVISNDVTREPDFLPNPMLPNTRSEIAIPMLIGEQVLGVLDIQDDKVNQFSFMNLQAKQTLANQIAVTLNNARQFQRSEQLQRQFQSVLDNASSAMISINIKQEITLFNQMAENVFGYRADEVVGQPLNMLMPGRFSTAHHQHIEDFGADEGVSARTMAERYLELFGKRKDGTEFPIEVSISKLKVGDEVLFTAILNDITTRKQSEESLRKRAIELQAVADVNAATSSILDQSELLAAVSNLTRERFELYHAHIYLMNETYDALILAAGSGAVGNIMAQQGHKIPLLREHSLVARSARTRKGVVVNNVLEEPDFLPNPLLPETRSEMAIPIIVSDEVIGVLDVQSEQVARFNDDDVRITTTLAGQIAVGIQNAQLFAESEQRVREAEATSTIAELFRSELSFDATFSEVLAVVREIMQADSAVMSRFNDDERKWYGIAGAGSNITPELVRSLIDVAEDYPHGLEALENNRVVAVENAHEYPNFPAKYTDETTLGIKSVLVLPITQRRTTIGVIFLNYASRYRRFSDNDLQISANFAFQISTGLERMEASEEVNRLASMIGQSDDFMAVADYHTQNIVYVNEGAAKLLGYASAADIQNVSIAFFHPPEGYQKVINEAVPAVAELGSWRGENQLVHRDGTLIPVDQNVFFIRDADGNPQGIASIMVDIRERVAQEAVRQTLFEISQLLNQATSYSETFQAINPTLDRLNIHQAVLLSTHQVQEDSESIDMWRMDAIWQRNADEGQAPPIGFQVKMTDFPAFEIVVADPENIQLIDNVAEAPHISESAQQQLLGQQRVAVAFIPIATQSNLLGLLAFSWAEPYMFTTLESDIFEGIRQQLVTVFEVIRANDATQLAQQQAEQRAAELQVVAEVSTAIATILDPEELLFEISNLTSESFNLYHAHVYLIDEDKEVLVLSAGAGTPGRIMVDSGHRISLHQTHSLVARAARSEAGVISNDVTKEPDFLPNPLLPQTKSEMSVPITVGGQTLGILDVQSSERNHFTETDVQIMSTLARQVGIALLNARLYQEQLETAERLREVDKLKSEFLASMSHELRTPLNSIIGYAEVILDGLDGPLNEELEEDVGAIHSSGRLLLNLINDILDLAKIEAGQMELEYADVNLREFLPRVLDGSRILVKDKPVELKIDVEDSVPDHIQADPVRLQQIVNNLISNAAKFTEEGSITLSTRADNGTLRIAVTDTGMGIPKEKLEVIFERFRQADQSSTRRAGGTGLGLDITRRLVRMHGGEITVESTLGEGSTFSFTIPVTPPNGYDYPLD